MRKTVRKDKTKWTCRRRLEAGESITLILLVLTIVYIIWEVIR
nr:MAG TPA: hypothetical protein [Caudoviricetes sp.]